LYINLPPVIKTLQASGLYTSTCLKRLLTKFSWLVPVSIHAVMLPFIIPVIPEVNLSVVCICSSTISGHGDTAVN